MFLIISTTLFLGLGYLPSLHSFPTRRSSDLYFHLCLNFWVLTQSPEPGGVPRPELARPCTRDAEVLRSEEHTSELQSPVHPVRRLLLEKKKPQASLYCLC